MRKAFLTFVLIVVFGRAVTPTAETSAPNETTLFIRNGYIITSIYVYDHWRWFVFDTMQDLTTFHQTFTNHLTAVPASIVEIMLDAPATPIYFGPKFFLAGHHPHPKYVLVDDIRPLEQLTGATDGILGLNVLTNYAISFDFVKGTVRFETNATPSAGALKLSMEKGNRLAFPASVENGRHIALGIDTANRGEISLTGEDWKTAFPNGPTKTNGVMVSDVSGKFHPTMAARLPFLKIGNEIYTNLICTRAISDASVSCIGAAFVQRHHVSIDYPNRKIILERVVDQKPIENTTGIHLKWIRRGAVVASIDPESPAAKSGLAEGDEILRIDGTRIGGMKANEIIERLSRRDRETMEITALHGTATITKKLDLNRRF